MRIFLAGAENPSWRQTLVAHGATSIAMSMASLRRRLPKTKPYLLSERLPEGVRVGLEPGDLRDKDDLALWAADYLKLAEDNVGWWDYAIELDALPDPDRGRLRVELALAGVPVVPVWRPEDGTRRLEELVESHTRIALPGAALDDIRLPALVRNMHRRGVAFHALGATKPDELAEMSIDTASSTSWTSPQRYGELIVWDGRRLRRYPPKYADQARRKHRRDAQRAGLDMDLFASGDPEVLTQLAIWSFMQMEESVGRVVRRAARSSYPQEEPFAHVPAEKPDTTAEIVAPASQVPASRQGEVLPLRPAGEQYARQLLPTMHMRDVEDETVAAPGNRPMLACDSCHLAMKCPAFNPGSECAYDIPVQLRTKDDLDRFLVGMLEIQGQRVLFARFAEEVEGGYPDPVVSGEMDRLFDLTERLKEIRDNREYMRMTVEARAAGGAISRIFGERVGGQAQELEEPIDANALTATVVS